MQSYMKDFYEELEVGETRRSAQEIVPIVIELIRPKRIIDVGCGLGFWLAVFKENGVDDIWGVDGDYIERCVLQIPEERFLPADLTKPLRVDMQFDLVVSLEVAEHLPKECAEMFVTSLTGLAPAILFSAAIPLQDGTDHVNLQWPHYWVQLFQERGYLVIDCIRKRVWENPNVESWYAQNILMFARTDYLENNPQLKKELQHTFIPQLSLVHPKMYQAMITHWSRLSFEQGSELSLRQVLSALPTLTINALRRRTNKFFI